MDAEGFCVRICLRSSLSVSLSFLTWASSSWVLMIRLNPAILRDILLAIRSPQNIKRYLKALIVI